MSYFLGLGKVSKTVLGSTHVVEQLSFCMFLSIHIFDFYLILESSFTFLAIMTIIIIFGVGVGFDNCFGVYSYCWISFIFYVSFNSDLWIWLNFGVLFTFFGPNGLFFGLELVRQLFWGLPMQLNNCYLLCFFQFWH